MKQSEPVKRPTIYSIGYQKLPTPEYLDALTECLSATLIDVRSKPVSRKKGFSRSKLETLLGDRYLWLGDQLGGMAPGVTAIGLQMLADFPRPAVLMCMEEAPGACHRHIHISTQLFRHGIDVAHIYRDVVIRASYLQGGIDRDSDDYAFNYLEQVIEIGGYDKRDPDDDTCPAHNLNPPFEGPWTGDSDLMRRYGTADAMTQVKEHTQ